MIRFKKIEKNLKERIPELIEEFRQNTKINVLYLFGSYAKDKIMPLSDIDIAILFKKNTPSSQYWDIKLDLLSRAVKILGTEEIDFVILNEAPLGLAYNILKDGRLLFCHNERERQGFQEDTVLTYLDTQHLREETFFHLRERIRKGRFGNDKGKYKKDIENIRRIFGEVAVYH